MVAVYHFYVIDPAICWEKVRTSQTIPGATRVLAGRYRSARINATNLSVNPNRLPTSIEPCMRGTECATPLYVMNVDICRADGRRTSRTTASLKAAAAATLLVLVAGCSGQRVAATGDQNLRAGQSPVDVIGAFASQASLNEEARVVLTDGQAANLRMVRRYSAASGRDCGEVIVSTSAARRAQIVCRSDQGTWVTARPLLRGG
jgi:hypothetical protein